MAAETILLFSYYSLLWDRLLKSEQQSKTGTRVEEVCRKMGISETTFYNWKKNYDGLGVSELRKLRETSFPHLESIKVFQEDKNELPPIEKGYSDELITVTRVFRLPFRHC